MLAPVVVLRELARLLDVYARPKHWPATDEQVAHKWADILSDVAPEQLTAAVSAYLREDHQFMPRPGTLRVLARQERRLGGAMSVPADYETWCRRGFTNARGTLEPCPCCGRAWQAQPRVTIVHNHTKHEAAAIPCTGSCDDPTHLGTYSIPPAAAPVTIGPGEIWVPPKGWTSELPEAARQRRHLNLA